MSTAASHRGRQVLWRPLWAVLIVAAALLACTQIAFVAVSFWADRTDHKVIVVTGGSMEPVFSAGDAILVDTDPVSVRPGAIITFQTNTGLVTHRVISEHDVQGVPHLRTQGEANDDPDPDLTALSAVVGVEERSFPGAGTMILFLGSPVGRVVTLLPLLLVIIAAEATVAVRTWRAASPDAPRAKHAAA